MVGIAEKTLMELIDRHTVLEWDKEKECFLDEIYEDYRDELDYESIIAWCGAEDPQEAFWEKLNEWYEESCYDRRAELLEMVKENWPDEVGFEEHRDWIWDWLLEHIYVKLPADYYLRQKVCVNIVIDTGDGSHDFILNDVYPHYTGRYGETIHNNASILWLTRQQGYRKTQLNQALRRGEYGGSKLLESIRTEIANCSTHMNALTFFVSMTLQELLKMQEKIRDSKKEEGVKTGKKRYSKEHCVSLTCGARCGLFDSWTGGGSILDIQLERDVEIPLQYIDSVLPDGGRGNSMANVYCMTRSFWTPALKKTAA